MPNFLKIVIITFFTLLLIACSDASSNNEPVDLSSTAKTKHTSIEIKEVTVNDLSKEFLDKHLVIDVRESSELLAGVIPNSVHIPMGMIDTKLPKYLQNQSTTKDLSAIKDKPILLYCAGGVRSYRSAETLKQLGFTNLTSLEGGFNAYKARNN